jgi:ApbE superfamily uncharacterized protein (UPF0280 family)
MKNGVIKIQRQFKESKILFQSDNAKAIANAIEAVKFHREKLEKYILLHPIFLHTLKPIPIDENAPRIVKIMAEAGELVNVGPMAAVAGALADLATETMLNSGAAIAIVEDGGEVSASSKEAFIVGLYAGKELFSRSLGFQISPSECPIGIATSSATISHAFSFGEADAATIFSETSAIADATATMVCNTVKGKDIETSIQLGLEAVEKLRDLVRGALIIREKHVGIVGRIPQMVKISKGLDVRQISIAEAISSDTILL